MLQSVFAAEDNQFGFKKNPSCNHAIYTVRNVVERYVNGGNTLNLCAIDSSHTVPFHSLTIDCQLPLKRNQQKVVLLLLLNFNQFATLKTKDT